MIKLLRFCGATLLLSLFLAAGCNNSAPPKPLTLAEIPAAMEKAFKSSTGQTKQLADSVVTSVNASDFTAASVAISQLSAITTLTKDQRDVTGKAMIPINENVTQQAVKDPGSDAAKLREFHLKNK